MACTCTPWNIGLSVKAFVRQTADIRACFQCFNPHQFTTHEIKFTRNQVFQRLATCCRLTVYVLLSPPQCKPSVMVFGDGVLEGIGHEGRGLLVALCTTTPCRVEEWMGPQRGVRSGQFSPPRHKGFWKSSPAASQGLQPGAPPSCGQQWSEEWPLAEQGGMAR